MLGYWCGGLAALDAAAMSELECRKRNEAAEAYFHRLPVTHDSLQISASARSTAQTYMATALFTESNFRIAVALGTSNCCDALHLWNVHLSPQILNKFSLTSHAETRREHVTYENATKSAAVEVTRTIGSCWLVQVLCRLVGGKKFKVKMSRAWTEPLCLRLLKTFLRGGPGLRWAHTSDITLFQAHQRCRTVARKSSIGGTWHRKFDKNSTNL